MQASDSSKVNLSSVRVSASKRGVGVFLIVSFITCLPAAGRGAPFDRTGLKRHTLSFQNRLFRNRALANHWRRLPIVVLAQAGRSVEAAKELVDLGGEVHFRNDDIDYIRGIVPTEKVDDYLHSPDVLDIQLGFFSIGPWDLDKSAPEARPAEPAPSDGVPERVTAAPPSLPLLSAAEMPAENPYLPTRDIGAPQFVGRHPGFDGRGATIAVIEDGDLNHPTLRTARALDGIVVPKIAGILNPYDLEHDEMVEAGLPIVEYAGMEEDDAVVRMPTEISIQDIAFVEKGLVYVAPGPGTYRFGYTMRPGDTSKARRVGVLWDPARRCVWVDTNENRDFRDEKPVQDFNQSGTIGFFPAISALPIAATKAVPAIELSGREGVVPDEDASAFAVTIDEAHHAVYIYTSSSDHGTMAASVAAGKAFLGGEANGVAPEAQIIYVHIAGNRIDRLIEGILLAAKDPRVDVITSSQGAATIPEDGESLLSLAMNRMVIRFRKPILQGAGNHQWPGMEQVMAHAAASQVLAVGGYNEGATRNAIYPGNHFVSSTEYVGWFSSNGPSSIGALKPDFLAPNLEVAAMPCSLPRRRRPELYRVTSFQLPRCYWVGGGTSSAAPFAAGAIALLISAAKQSNLPYDAESLYWAIRMSARRLPGYGTYRQGSGLIQVDRAWDLLRQHYKLSGAKLAFSAAIRSPLGRYLKTPEEGVGLYENGGWAIGERGIRIVKVLRGEGLAGAMECRVELVGGDGTFTVPRTIMLPTSTPVEIPVHVDIREAGIHDAILRVVDLRTDLPLDQTALTIVVGDALTAGNSYRFQVQGTLKPEESLPAFIDVPANVSILKVQVTVTSGNVHMFGQAPSFLGGWVPLRQYLYPARWTHSEPQPEPGVWQFRIDNFEHGDLDWRHFGQDATLTLRVEALDPQVNGETRSLLHIDKLSPKPATTMAGLATVRERGFLYSIPLSLSESWPETIDINIPAGAEYLLSQVRTEYPSNRWNADLYLYDCAQNAIADACKLSEIRSLTDASAQIFVRWPTPGHWKVLIDPTGDTNRTRVRLSELIGGSSPGQAAFEDETKRFQLRGKAAAEADARWRAVEVVESTDAIGTRDEEMSSFRDLERYPESSFLPVPLAIEAEPLDSSARGRCWRSRCNSVDVR
jgi:hypothetical protein